MEGKRTSLQDTTEGQKEERRVREKVGGLMKSLTHVAAISLSVFPVADRPVIIRY